jgi:hypothetical protein
MGLINESNRQYYIGAQSFIATGVANETFTATFDTNLVWATSDPANLNWPLNNFSLERSVDGGLTYVPFYITYTVIGNTITVTGGLNAGDYLKIQLTDQTVWDNNGSYSYTKLIDAVNNYIVAYVGPGKLIPNAKRTDVLFHAKRGLQEFSYDTLKSIKSQELQIPASLSLIIPQDYVNYVRLAWKDQLGVLHTIYPNNGLTANPYQSLAQDDTGVPVQDALDENLETTSLIERAWRRANDRLISGWNGNWWSYYTDYFSNPYPLYWNQIVGQRYGLNPETSQWNGWFGINEREGKFSFSSNLIGKIILIEYISDGLAYDLDTRIPKLAEDALYSWINYSILSTRRGIPEYIVKRYQKEKSAKLRNAKIRLSNVKLDEIVQVMRGKSKWIKH